MLLVYFFMNNLLFLFFFLQQVSTAWGTGLIIGPALGGFLAQVFSFSRTSKVENEVSLI